MPLEGLVLRDVDWSLTQEHVEQRGIRKGTHEFAQRVEWATKACSDPLRLTGRSSDMDLAETMKTPTPTA